VKQITLLFFYRLSPNGLCPATGEEAARIYRDKSYANGINAIQICKLRQKSFSASQGESYFE
jgi:hypothetical protein